MIPKIIAKNLNVNLWQVEGAVKLFEQGSTIPFISRYRKEATGSLDEVQVTSIKEQLDKLTELQARKQTIISTIKEQEKLTPELLKIIENCWSSSELEDIYLPYKPKRRTRAAIAREKGLEPLATLIMLQNPKSNPDFEANKFLTEDVKTVEEAISGASDIIAEIVAEDAQTRSDVRDWFSHYGILHTRLVKGKEESGVKFSDYFDANSQLRSVSSHRFLAMQRGVEEGVLKLSIDVEVEDITRLISRSFVMNNSSAAKVVEGAVQDSFKRLVRPSIETEMLSTLKERADAEAIAVFGENLRQLLLSSPLGQKRVLALDPGFRTGCKVVVLDANGELKDNCAIYPHPPKNDVDGAKRKIAELIRKYKIEAFAIGDGTAGRETEAFVKSMPESKGVQLFMVSEDGASIYSASPVAREEFPEYDVTVRGAVSIGRRLIDPLSELVKIDPKSIGVGQYQHSVDQSKLKSRLTTVVESCVNRVGVNINTASKHILTYISGLGAALAENIVKYRAENGEFRSRKDLLKVPRLGAKAYEQAAGFLRIVGGKNPLDSSAVHPESYYIVERMALDMGVGVSEFIHNQSIRQGVKPQRYISDGVGLPTIQDILDSLDRRGLDPRKQIVEFSFDINVHTIEDLRVGMRLPGIVSNITAFGAFVDVGIKQDGLVHISQLADRYISSPTDVVSLGQRVMVRVLEVDMIRKRVALSMRG